MEFSKNNEQRKNWTEEVPGIDARKIKEKVYRFAESGNEASGGGIIGNISARIDSVITMKRLEQKTEDRKNIEKRKYLMKEASGEEALVLAKAELAKRWHEGEALSEEGKINFAASVEKAVEKGKDVALHFSPEELAIARSVNIDADKISFWDPYVAEILGGKTAEEYMQEHAATGDWKKYNGYIRIEHLGDIINAVDDIEEVEKHYSRSGAGVKKDYAQGCEKLIEECVKKADLSDGEEKKKNEAEDELKEKRKQVALITGDFEKAYGKKDKAGEYIKDILTGNIEVYTEQMKDVLKEFGGKIFKKLTKRSKELYIENIDATGGVFGLDLKGENSEVIESLIRALEKKDKDDKMFIEAAKHPVLGQFIGR